MAGDRVAVPGGELEEAVLHHIWEAGVSTVREVHEAVGSPSGLVYTTIARVLDRLNAKGLVTRDLLGRVHVYRAGIDRAEVERTLVRTRVGRLLGADPRPAMTALVDAVEALDATLLDDLAREIERRRQGRADGT